MVLVGNFSVMKYSIMYTSPLCGSGGSQCSGYINCRLTMFANSQREVSQPFSPHLKYEKGRFRHKEPDPVNN